MSAGGSNPLTPTNSRGPCFGWGLSLSAAEDAKPHMTRRLSETEIECAKGQIVDLEDSG